MRPSLLAGLLVGAGLAAASLPDPAAAQPITWRDLLSRERPATEIRIPYGPHPDQFGELWLPPGPGPHPVIVMVHGGCWQAALPGVELMAYIAEDLRRAGIAVWNLEYRRLGTEGAGYPGTFQDVAAGADHLRIVARSHALDLTRVIATGHSAGGHLALWLGARDRLPAGSPLRSGEPLRLRAVVTLAGINDLSTYRERGPDACGGPPTIDALTGVEGRAGADVFADTSPAAMLPLGLPQVILSGELDHIVPHHFGVIYAAAADAAGDDVVETTYAAAGHFELIDPTSTAWADIRRIMAELLR
ncbi:MAG: hypothetical protein RLY86_3445 [Pseudomonadota bacterium]